MAIEIVVPRLGWSMDEGTFGGWLKQDGDSVQPGEMLFVLEGEKSAEDIECFDAGILRIPQNGPQTGDTVTVGQLLGFLVEQGEELPTEKLAGTSVPAVSHAVTSQAVEESLPTPVTTQSSVVPVSVTQKKTSSPRARRLAREHGVDINAIQGSGRNGRVRERDVISQPAAQANAVTAIGGFHKFTQIRKTTIHRLSQAAAETVPVTLHTKADATNLLAWRKNLTAATQPDAPIPTINDLLVKLTAVALRTHPQLNAYVQADGLQLCQDINIAIAIDTDQGLVAPAINNADRILPAEIAVESRGLIELAKTGKLKNAHVQGATFTVTNLGMFGIDHFSPVINQPQCAILGVGRIQRQPAVIEDVVVPRDTISLSLTFDHRGVDGGPAARFLDHLRQLIEYPFI